MTLYEFDIKISTNFQRNLKNVIGGDLLKRKTLKSLFSVIISVIVVCCLFIFLYLKNKNSIIQSNLIKEADSIVNENIINCDAIKKSEEQ